MDTSAPSGLADWRGRAHVTLVVSPLFALGVAAFFRLMWDPPVSAYGYNVPIAVPMAAFLLERSNRGASWRSPLLDGVVICSP